MKKEKRPPTMNIGPSRRPKVKAPDSLPVEKKAEPTPEKQPWFGNDPQTLSRDFTTTLVQSVKELVPWAITNCVQILDAIDWLYALRQLVLTESKVAYGLALRQDIGKVTNRPILGHLTPEESYMAICARLSGIINRELELGYAEVARARRVVDDFRMKYPMADLGALRRLVVLRPGPKWPEDRP